MTTVDSGERPFASERRGRKAAAEPSSIRMGATNPDRSGWSRLTDADMIVALSAVLIGVCALVVSLVQVRIMRQEQHATVWPQVSVGRTYTQHESFGLIAVNAGIGPARVRSFRVLVDGQERRNWPDALDALLGQKERAWNLESSSLRGRTIPAGEVIRIVQVRGDSVADALFDAKNRLNVSICYCSVYDRCWTIDLASDPAGDPPEVRQCTASADPFRG